MIEIEPQQPMRGLSGVAHQIVMIDPDDGDEEIAHGIAEPCGPEEQERLKVGCTGGFNSSTSTVMRTANTPSDNALSRSGVALHSMLSLPCRRAASDAGAR